MRIKIGENYIDTYLMFIMVGIYTILKVYRNSINYADTAQGGIWNIIIVLLVVLGLFSFLFNRLSLPVTVKIAMAYALLVWFNGLLTFSVTSVSSFYYFLVAPCFAPIMYYAYQLCKTGVSEKSYRVWYFLWVIILALLLYTYIKYFQKYMYYESSDKIALNNSYYAACAIPFFLRKRDKFGFSMAGVSAIIVFISNKRAGIIAIVLAMIYYLFINAKLSNSTGKMLKRLLLGIGVVAVVGVLFYYIDTHYSLNIFTRLYKLLDDGGSGRTDIYKYVLNEYANSNLLNKLIGHGVSSINSLQMGLSSAHCDFLNILYEYGVFAVLLLIVFYCTLFATLRAMIKTGYSNSPEFAFSIVVSLFFSLFSANLDNQSFCLVLAVYWAVEIAEWENKMVTPNMGDRYNE